jgi:hypothetical protein
LKKSAIFLKFTLQIHRVSPDSSTGAVDHN